MTLQEINSLGKKPSKEWIDNLFKQAPLKFDNHVKTLPFEPINAMIFNHHVMLQRLDDTKIKKVPNIIILHAAETKIVLSREQIIEKDLRKSGRIISSEYIYVPTLARFKEIYNGFQLEFLDNSGNIIDFTKQ